MVDPVTNKTATNEMGNASEADRRELRRQKLGALREKRSDETAAVVAAAPPRAEASPRGKGAGKAAGGGKLAGMMGGEDSEAKRKAIARVVRVLTDTPADATGMVPETTFSKAGVKRLMDMLHERSSGAGASGARVAGGLLRFLKPADGEESIHGASLTKLQRAGKMVAMRGGGRGRRKAI